VAQVYDAQYYTYPVFTTDLGFEGSTKRFRTMPMPEDVYRFALLGLPKIFPLTQEPITPDDAKIFLENAITEIEMSLNIDITPVDHWQSFDYIDGMFSANYTGLKLERWPATKVVDLMMKFPHTQSVSPGITPLPGQSQVYQQYTIPKPWVALRRNRINVMAAFGAVSVSTGEAATATGLFSYITGFARGAYQPAIIECRYTAGFENDKLPSSVWDLIVTLASLRFLEAVAAPLFPIAGVTVAIDGVSQSASLPGPQLLLQKIQSLKDQYAAKVNAVTRNFGRTFKLAFIGA